MPKFDLVYHSGCPLVPRARAALKDAGIENYSEFNQDRLPEDHPYRRYTSPSIFRDGVLLAGSRSASFSCSILDWEKVTKDLTASLRRE